MHYWNAGIDNFEDTRLAVGKRARGDYVAPADQGLPPAVLKQLKDNATLMKALQGQVDSLKAKDRWPKVADSPTDAAADAGQVKRNPGKKGGWKKKLGAKGGKGGKGAQK